MTLLSHCHDPAEKQKDVVNAITLYRRHDLQQLTTNS